MTDRLITAVVGSMLWGQPRRWCQTSFALRPLAGTEPGELAISYSDDVYKADFAFPVSRPILHGGDANAALARVHAVDIVNLSMVLGVVLGAPLTAIDLHYESNGFGPWAPGGMLRPPHMLWDWPEAFSVPIDATEISSLVGLLPVEQSPALTLLSEASDVDNPVARFLCVWQALAFHQGTDEPRRLDQEFFARVGVALDQIDSRGSRESKYAKVRNMLSHPKGRDAGSYRELDEQARAVSDELARLLLRDILASSNQRECPPWWG